MAISLKHAFTSAIAEGPDATKVRTSNWNAEHVLTQATGKILGRKTAADGATEELTTEALSIIGVPMPNYVFNPSGAVNQAGVGSQTDGTYDFDQWLALTQSNAVTSSQVADAENGTPYMMRLSQANASAQRFGRIQWIEKLFCRDLRGQAVVLSARVRMSATTTLRYGIVEWTGTADSITKDVVNDWTNGTFTAGNFFNSTSITVAATGSIALTANTLADITALTGTVSGSMNNLAVFFWTDSAQAQNVTLDVAKVKLEKGSYPTPFVARSFSQEWDDCRRYYEASYSLGVAPGTSTLVGLYSATVPSNTVPNQQYYGTYQYIVGKRTAPTFTAYGYGGTANAVSNNAATDLAVNSGAPGVANGPSSFAVYNNSGGNLTTSGNNLFFHWKADARL